MLPDCFTALSYCSTSLESVTSRVCVHNECRQRVNLSFNHGNPALWTIVDRIIQLGNQRENERLLLIAASYLALLAVKYSYNSIASREPKRTQRRHLVFNVQPYITASFVQVTDSYSRCPTNNNHLRCVRTWCPFCREDYSETPSEACAIETSRRFKSLASRWCIIA